MNKASYKKSIFNDKLKNFLEKIESYYHNSKKYYVTRKLNYSKFITIIRQICKHNNILYTSKIKYDKSNYDIIYYIYF